MTIQDIITERNYWRKFKTRRNFDRKFAILFEAEKKIKGGGSLQYGLRFNTG